MVCRSIGCKNLKGQIHDNLAEVVVPEREQKNIRDPQMPLSVLVRVRDLRLKSGAHGSGGTFMLSISSGQMGKTLSGRVTQARVCWE